MAREGAGDKLAHIAADEKLPATQVRQRVSRLRRLMKQRWVAELTAVAAIVLIALIVWQVLKNDEPVTLPTPHPEEIDKPVVDPRVAEAKKLRGEALESCEAERWEPCVQGLDDAAALDPAGDTAPEIQQARKTAAEALERQREETQTEDPKFDRKTIAPKSTPTSAPPKSTPPPTKPSASPPAPAPVAPQNKKQSKRPPDDEGLKGLKGGNKSDFDSTFKDPPTKK
jgi:hypothetical protein